jgi:hypothetical protein
MQRYEVAWSNLQCYDLSWNHANETMTFSTRYPDGTTSYHILLGLIPEAETHILDEAIFPNSNHAERDIRDWYVGRSRIVAVHLLDLPPRVKCRMMTGMWRRRSIPNAQ